MKLLLDEMYTGFKEHFEVLGWEVVTVEEAGLKGKRDKKVVEYAKGNSLLLVTEDQKHAELADLAGIKFVLVSNKMLARCVDSEIREKYGNKQK